MNPQKTIINGSEYELVPAEVIDFDFTGKSKERLYSIRCKLLGAFGSQASSDFVEARSLDANIKNIPIAGEVVMLLKAPTAYNSALATGQEYFYTNPVSIQSSVHHNGLPGISETLDNTAPSNSSTRNNASDGVLSKSSSRLQLKTTIDPAFPERLDVYPIQPYSGDIILEGRWGQSIRFGSTVDTRRTYPNTPYWKKGFGETGNPLLIISNGTNPKNKKFNEFILENPDEDDASIWMTSGQEVRFTPASTYTPSIKSKSVDLFRQSNFGGNQVIIASDRIVFNARSQEIIAFSKGGIGLSSEITISIDGKNLVEAESKRINLGLDAVSPALLGDRSMDWLNELCVILSKLLTTLTVTTVPTGVGPSGPPITTPQILNIQTELLTLQQKIQFLQSRLVFLNEFSNGPGEEAVSSARQREDVEQMRKNGEEPLRLATNNNGFALSEKDLPTSITSTKVLFNPTSNEVYGIRQTDALTKLYDIAYSKWLETGEWDDSAFT